MGVFVPLNVGVQVEILHRLGGVLFENRLWFIHDTPPITQPDLDSLAVGVAGWWINGVLPLLSFELETVAVIAREWTSFPPPLQSIILVNLPGGSADLSYSANVAVVVPFKWAIGYREKANKNYVAGIPDSAVVLNTVQPVFNDALFEAYVSLIDIARTWPPGSTWRWVVTSAFDNNAPRSEQVWTSCQGVPQNFTFKLGQRRRRLPSP